MIEGLSSNSRIHVILIPGFAGFDALGQLEYYAGRENGRTSRTNAELFSQMERAYIRFKPMSAYFRTDLPARPRILR
jgi:hypothetical protein